MGKGRFFWSKKTEINSKNICITELAKKMEEGEAMFA